jgi:hypothetical protein
MSKLVVVASLLFATATRASADDGDRWEGVMMAGQYGGGVVGGAAVGTAGMFLATGLAEEDSNWYQTMGYAGLGFATGVVVGTTVGVKLTGDWRGGNGSWLATGGAAAGGALLTFATFPLYAEKVPWPVAAGLASLTVVGPAIVGYQLSTDEKASENKARVVVPLMTLPF